MITEQHFLVEAIDLQGGNMTQATHTEHRIEPTLQCKPLRPHNAIMRILAYTPNNILIHLCITICTQNYQPLRDEIKVK